MRPLILILLLLSALPAQAADCGSIVASVCARPVDDPIPTRKVLKVKPTVTPYLIGDSFPVEGHFFLMDPLRYGLRPSDGTWRYYALSGVVYRVQNGSGEVLEIIRSRRTAHLR